VPDADVAVVGGGIIGCMVARTLAARAPGTSVIVLDRHAAGCGASQRSAGLHIPRGRTDRVRRMASFSQDYYDRLRAGCPTLPIHPLDMLVVASQAPDQYLDGAALTQAGALPEWIRAPTGAGAWRGAGCHYADVWALTQALATELRPFVSVREGLRVTGVEPRDGSVVLRLGTGDTVTAGQVVLAPGPWLAAPAWRELVAPVGARVKKIVAAHLDLAVSGRDSAVIFEDEDAFLLPMRGRGHWLFSYTCREWDVEPDALAGGLSRRDLDAAREVLARYAPDLVPRVVGGRVFCDAYSGTGEPQVRTVDPAGRVVFAGAANGSGYRLAPAIAEQAADLLLSPIASRSTQCVLAGTTRPSCMTPWASA
jgi:D-arginine dehydrogenase